MRYSRFTAITRDNRRNTSEFENEWRTNKIPGWSQNGWNDCFSHFSYHCDLTFR